MAPEPFQSEDVFRWLGRWRFQTFHKLGCDIGGAKELGAIYFPSNWGAKDPQNLPNHRVVRVRLPPVSPSSFC